MWVSATPVAETCTLIPNINILLTVFVQEAGEKHKPSDLYEFKCALYPYFLFFLGQLVYRFRIQNKYDSGILWVDAYQRFSFFFTYRYFERIGPNVAPFFVVSTHKPHGKRMTRFARYPDTYMSGVFVTGESQYARFKIVVTCYNKLLGIGEKIPLVEQCKPATVLLAEKIPFVLCFLLTQMPHLLK